MQEEVIISDIEWHLDDPSQNTITVQNYKTHFEDLFQRIQATVQTVQYNEVTYPNTRSIIDEEKRINQALLVASLSRVAGAQRPLTTDGSIAIDGDSIDILNLTNRLNRVRLSSEGITISSDGGATWSAAITGEGINIGNVISDFINTKEIWIGSKDSPSFRWDKNGISAFMLGNESQGEPKYNFKQFVRFDRFGLYGIDLTGNPISEYIVDNIEDIKNTASFAVTWDGFFIKNKYTNGRVEITSEDDFRVIQTLQDTDTYQYRDHERIKIGALEHDTNGNPTKYGININQTTYNESTGRYEDTPSFTTGTDGNITITGTIYATGGDFKNIITVGKQEGNNPPPWIEINGLTSKIYSSNYQDGAGPGWLIDASGDAYFNNITARGAIKTAVFEYAEIQAVGGIFIFRPSSTIRSAEVGPEKQDPTEERDLIVTVEKPVIFKENSWCKISNYTENGEADNPDIDIDDIQHFTPEQIANNNGLLHIYKISNITTRNNKTYITLEGATAMVGPIDLNSGHVVTDVSQFIGGALVDMGNINNTSNYGIGINSSDNTVNLPAKAISLFETTINNSPNANPKVTYYYTAILGTLPHLSNPQVDDSIYNTYLENTQGIFTDNMYLGNNEQYIAFYTDKAINPQKHLVIKAKEFILQGGTKGQSGYIYLSTEDHPIGNEGITINDFTPNNLTEKWRLVIGDKFGVTNVGSLYASNVNLSGKIIATSGTIGGCVIDEHGNLQISSAHITDLDIDTDKIEYSDNNYAQVTSDGLKIYKDGKDGKLKGLFGTTISLYANDGSNSNGVYPKTDITSNGITIAYSDLYKTSVDNTGMKIYAGDADKSIASFGETTIIGNANKADYAGYIQIDSKSFMMLKAKMVNDKVFVNFSDLRGEDGYLYIEETFTWGDGTVSTDTNFKDLNYNATSNKPAIVYIDGVAMTEDKAKISGKYAYFWNYTTIAVGAVIKLSYYTSSSEAQCFTFGRRALTDNGLDTAPGALSMSLGTDNSVGGSKSLAIGSSNKVPANYSLAVGVGNQVTGWYSVGAGYYNKTNGYNSYCFGSNLSTRWSNEFIVGTFNDPTRSGKLVVGAGSSGEPKNSLIVDSLGIYVDGQIATTELEYVSSATVGYANLSYNGLTYMRLGSTGSTRKIKENIDIISDESLKPEKLYSLKKEF